MLAIVLKAYLKLIQFDVYLARGNFKALYDKVRGYKIRNNPTTAHSVEGICLAIDMAGIWYWKKALCLQRSAATACLLRSFGIPAQLVIGVQQLPFRSHAWVEVDGRVVNDRPYMNEIYSVLDRC